MAYCSSLGLGTTLLPGVLWGRLAGGADITKETVACAEEIAGVKFTDEQRAMMVENLRRQQRSIASCIRSSGERSRAGAPLRSGAPGVTLDGPQTADGSGRLPVMATPASLEELAYLQLRRCRRSYAAAR